MSRIVIDYLWPLLFVCRAAIRASTAAPPTKPAMSGLCANNDPIRKITSNSVWKSSTFFIINHLNEYKGTVTVSIGDMTGRCLIVELE